MKVVADKVAAVAEHMAPSPTLAAKRTALLPRRPGFERIMSILVGYLSQWFTIFFFTSHSLDHIRPPGLSIVPAMVHNMYRKND